MSALSFAVVRPTSLISSEEAAPSWAVLARVSRSSSCVETSTPPDAGRESNPPTMGDRRCPVTHRRPSHLGRDQT